MIIFSPVGGGSAGSLVAARLAKDKKSEVLLIEAGGLPSKLHDIPVTAPMLQRSDCDWQYVTVPQKNACLGLQNKVYKWFYLLNFFIYFNSCKFVAISRFCIKYDSLKK